MSGETANGKTMTISLSVLRWILPIVFGSGIAYALVKDMPAKQEANSKKIEVHSNKIVDADKRISLVEKDIGYILGGIEDIKEAMKIRGRRQHHRRDSRRDRDGSSVTPE